MCKKKEKKERIIESAIKMFNYYGVTKTSIQDIAKDSGIAVGTVYLYFKSKDEILFACTEKFVDFHRDFIKEILEENILPQDKIKKYILGRFIINEELRTKTPHSYDIALAVLKLRPERLKEESEIMFSAMYSFLKEGCDKKIFKINSIEEDCEVFLYSIAYFFPVASKDNLNFASKEKLSMLIEWFIKKWLN